MEKVNIIKAEDLANLQQDASGNFFIPEGYEIYRVIDEKQKRIDEINKQLDIIYESVKPSDEELIEFGKMYHPYYDELMTKQMLEDELKTLEE